MLPPLAPARPARGLSQMQALFNARRQARYWLDSSGWGSVLVYADVVLSVLSVIVYIASTYP